MGLSPHWVPVFCGVRQEFSLPDRSRTSLCWNTAARAPSVLLLSARGVSQVALVWFCQVGPGCASSRVPWQTGSKLAPVGHSLSQAARAVLTNSGLFCDCDVGSVLVDDFEALGAVQNLRDVLDCFLVSDDPFCAVRLEECHRSTVSTLFH